MGKHHRERGDGCCSLVGCIKKPEKVCLMLICFGVLLTMISLFVPRWRVDSHGMQNWEKVLGTSVLTQMNLQFKSRTYGLMKVESSISQSWKAQAQAACTYRDIQSVASFGTSIYNTIANWDINYCKSSTSDECMNGAITHLTARCESYGEMERMGMLVLSFSMIGIFLCLGSLIAGFQCNTSKVGGVVFGMQLFGAMLTLIFNMVWAATTDAAFKKIMQSAWFPYAELGAGYYLHLFGALFMLTAAIFYGIIVMPDVANYDPLQKMIEKREKRLMDAKTNAARQQHMQNQQQGLMMQQGMMVQPGGMIIQQQPVMMQQPMMIQQQVAPQAAFGIGGGNVMMQQQVQPTTFGVAAPVPVSSQQHYAMPVAPPR